MSAKKKILVIEDEPEFRLMLRARLEANGYQVNEAVDGMDGLKKVRNMSPDLILLDIIMPKMDGYKVARRLKFDKKHQNIPIVMLTVRSQQSDRETGKAAGCDAYLVKPCNSEDIVESVNDLLVGEK